jgi:chromate transporter
MKSENVDRPEYEPPPEVDFKSALAFWAKLGFISFGGPAGQIAIMHQELVERRRWLSERRFLHALNYCMLLPGPEAQQLATYIGWLMHRTAGGIAAGLLFILPSFFLLLLLGWIYLSFGNLPVIASLLYGIKPAVTAIVLFAAYRIGARVLKNGLMWFLAIFAFIAIFALNMPFPLIVLTAAIIGFLGEYFAPGKFSMTGGHGKTGHTTGKALIDDNTPVPEHAKFRWNKLINIGLTALFLWVIVMALLCWQFGWEGVLTQSGWFFTKAALLTFGGAYAVLPYVYQGAVEHYHWLTATQMIDALALGETTPGPLIMVVTFVGFLAGWNQLPFGPESYLLSGIMAALIVTYFTFLPSFVFILAGGPLVESTHGNLKFTAPLSAITAAVTGVILNLAVFFAWHVLWPNGFDGEFDGISALIGAYALLLLFRYKAGVAPVILLSAISGLLVAL